MLAIGLATAFNAGAQGKVVRLRTGDLHPPPHAHASPRPAAGKIDPSNGLFLVQFESAVEPEWRAHLRSRGVELLQYVPDDTFVARFRGVNPGELQDIPYVRWFDRFTPVDRVDRRLLNPPHRSPADGPEVTAILANDASPEESARLIGLFRGRVSREAHRFGTVIRGQLPTGQTLTAAESPALLWLEPASRFTLADEEASAVIAGPSTNHVLFAHALGYTGAGVTVAVADSGLDNGTLANHTELTGRTKALRYYGGLTSAADENAHGTHVAGIIAGRGITLEGDAFGYFGMGVAPGAQLVVQRIFDANGTYRPTPPETLTRDAVQLGAILGNNSWTVDSQGRYDVNAMQFDELTRDADPSTPGDQPYLLIFAAGNGGPGPQTIGSPAVGKNVIAVGASQGPRTNYFTYNDGIGALASISSRGPCEDGRIKPDLVAPGTWIASLLSAAGRVENTAAAINNEFAFMTGTSQASPHVAGAAAVFVQYYRSRFDGATPSPALIKAALINSAADLSSAATGPVPNMDEGWGRVDVAALVRPDRTIEFLDQSVLLVGGQVHERNLFVNRTNVPLQLTLVYTDAPGFPAAIPALVNNLDLELVGPDGRIYHGNQFDRGQSAPDVTPRDTVNNVEGIRLATPAAGEYTVRVRAARVSQDSCRSTSEVDQDFALVISGGLPRTGESVIALDRAAYRRPDRIQIKLIDPDLAGQPAAAVTARSQTEPAGQLLMLTPAGAGGSFTGSVQTAAGPAVDDGQLQVAHGDWIQVDYFDASHSGLESAYADADLMPPVITGVRTTNAFGQLAIGWRTDEPASSRVRFGDSPASLDRSVFSQALARSHTLELPRLNAGQAYYFVVESVDAAGNAATNNNAGASYTFEAGLNPTVLLVDAYQPSPPDPVIPLSSYTFPLTEMGITYDVWSQEAAQSLPELDSLSRYPVIIWRINDSFRRPGDAIPVPQQEAIRQYVNAGGSFFMASMSVLSRLLNQNSGDFVTNVLHVQRFTLSSTPFSHCLNCDEDFRVPRALGAVNDPVGQGLDLLLDYRQYTADGLVGPDFGDTFKAATNATPFLVEAVSGKACGMRFPRTGDDVPGRVVFVSVPLDSIPLVGDTPNNRTDFLRKVIRFLTPGVGGVGTVALNQGAYTLPDLITVELADSDLEGHGLATVSFTSDSHSDPVTVQLPETTRGGLFRGTIPLSGGPTPPPGALPAVHGDGIQVEYIDASAGGLPVRASAVVDTALPEIAGLEVKAGFFDATISWTTSKPTDALIQYGESAFLGGTVYRPEQQSSHTLRLIGLVPGRPYFFKIAVRDEAGNLTRSDNDGELHSFATFEPLRPNPTFFDNVEDPTLLTNWTVLSTEASQREWSSGPPNDGHTGFAYSGTSVWASNLYGEPADVIDTYLISPAFDLRGMNVAELQFQHHYNFNDQTGFDYISHGRLLISTNVQTDPFPIAVYENSVFDWTEEHIDLTPYGGRVVFLIWHHEIRSASAEPPVERPGWALDDIEVTARNVPAGSLRVTNNISQARFTLQRNGLIRSGQGSSFLFTNLPPGNYVLAFEPIPYYVTPPDQTNPITANLLTKVGGQYGIVDANLNGMSDSWEIAQFGSVDMMRTRATDTDADGFTDYAEFIAGTDPLEPNSFLRLTDPIPLSPSLLRFSWPSVGGYSYQLQGSTSAAWIPMSSWIRASGELTSVIIPPPAPGDPYLFRVEVRP